MSTFSSLTPYDSDEHDNGWDVASSRIEELVRISPPEKTHWDATTQQITPCDPPHPEAEDAGSHYLTPDRAEWLANRLLEAARQARL